MTTFVVVGGDAAGMSAASKAKRDDPALDVVVFEKGEWGATISDIEGYDLAYAPPFNTTWDPVLTAAEVMSGTL